MIMLEQRKAFYVKGALVATTVFLASVIVFLTGIRFGFLSIITAFVLMQLFFTELRKKALERILGPIIASIIIVTILTMLHQHYLLMLVAATLITMVFIYYYVRGFFPYSMILGAITVAMISALDVSANLSDAIQLAFYWVANLIIGSCVVIVVDLAAVKWVLDKRTISAVEQIGAISIFQKFKNQIIVLLQKSQYEYKALIVSLRAAVALMIILLLNHRMQWSFIDIQAVIAGTIVAAQPTVSLTHQRGMLRIIGIVAGTILAIAFAFILQIHPSLWLIIFLITISLGILTVLSEYYRYWEYAFLQAGVMIPLILVTSDVHKINIELAVERGLGSLEGVAIAVLMVYFSLLLLNYRNKNDTFV